jgi:hypothetical protein
LSYLSFESHYNRKRGAGLIQTTVTITGPDKKKDLEVAIVDVIDKTVIASMTQRLQPNGKRDGKALITFGEHDEGDWETPESRAKMDALMQE